MRLLDMFELNLVAGGGFLASDGFEDEPGDRSQEPPQPPYVPNPPPCEGDTPVIKY